MDYSQLKVFVAGHNGLVGSALCRAMARRGYRNIITRTRAELDLLNSAAVDEFFRSQRPEVVYLAAAKVGGIYANNTYPADFILDNLKVQNNVIEAAWRHGVEKASLPRLQLYLPENGSSAVKGGVSVDLPS